MVDEKLTSSDSDPIDLPLVRPANFETASPFDDPFDDNLASAHGQATAREDPFDGGEQRNPPPPPRLIHTGQVQPIGRPMESAHQWSQRGRPGEAKGPSVRWAQSQQNDGASQDNLELPGSSDAQDDDFSAEMEARDFPPIQSEPNRSAPPAFDDLTPDDLSSQPLIPGESAMEAELRLDENLFDNGMEDRGFYTREPSDCDRIYQGRDCCDEDERCQTALIILGSKPLSTIGLNISPPYQPQPGFDFDPEAQSKDLAESESRVWLDRQGKRLAVGRFIDYRHGDVYVLEADGTTTAIPYRDLGDDALCFVNAWWSVPPECRLGDDPFTRRSWAMTTFTWKASALCHKPLYFEQQQLERYGHSAGPVRQPVLSASHFMLNLILLPYSMGIHPPNECLYSLGYYRPGSCAPWLVPAFPLSLRGAAYQAAAIAALAPLPY